jgi:hypothetical protein
LHDETLLQRAVAGVEVGIFCFQVRKSMNKLFARAISVELSDFDVLSNFDKIVEANGRALQPYSSLAEGGQP